MWPLAVLTTLLSLSGYYALEGQQRQTAASQGKAAVLADSMAVYREAVRQYFASHPGPQRSVTLAALRASHALPAWSPLYTDTGPAPWANYRAADGTIYIYAAAATQNIAADVVRLSRNSVLAGVFRAGDTTLYSPVFGNTGIPLPTPAEAAIPDGSPVWIATSP
ncbi:type IV pilus biogenesis protein PilM [Oxalobacteraceae bacterium]|nr:type IV pilus biogenesis protein PilM [Oxalobacteraceae bacterium]